MNALRDNGSRPAGPRPVGARGEARQSGDANGGASSNPMALQAYTISAMCDDLFDIGSGKSTSFRRLNALHDALTSGGGQ